jgi:hypothetical protein
VKAVEEQLSWKTSVFVVVWRFAATASCDFHRGEDPHPLRGLLLRIRSAIPTVFVNEKI